MTRRAAAVALLLAAVPAQAEEPPPVLKVIAPGNEPLLGEMLGGSLPGGCALEGASIDRTRVVARYACAAGPATITLLHASDPAAGAAALHTAAFAVAASAPRELVDAVAAQVRAREAAFRWVTVEAPPSAAGPAEAQAGPPPPHRFFTAPGSFAAAVLGVAAVAGAAFLVAFRRRPPA